jgi:glycosyltransferase involved in cell wall biosynthesis
MMAPISCTVIIPTVNSSRYILETCESLLAQREQAWEAIFIDSGSTDRTVEIIQSYREARFRLQALVTINIFELINRAIHMAQSSSEGGSGTAYSIILFPGDTFLTPSSLFLACREIETKEKPDLFYGILASSDTLRGRWIKNDLFKSIGLFASKYRYSADFEFYCRVSKEKGVTVASESRVYVMLKDEGSLRSDKEIFLIRWSYFGFFKALIWLCKEKTKNLCLWLGSWFT